MNTDLILRRSFLSSTLAVPAVLRAQNTQNRLRVAFIGVGNRGGYLAKRMTEVTDADIVAICDLEEDRARKAIESVAPNHKPALYTDYRKMLEERKDIDAVVVATPVDTHLKLGIAVLEAGKHIYAEKPVAGTAAECNTMLAAVKNAKGIYQAGYQLRHDPNRAAAMKFIKEGGIGRVIYAQGYRHSGDLPRNTLWLFDRKRSGDNIVEQACHILDLFVWAIGKPPLRAMGSGGVNLYKDTPAGRTTMDNYAVIYEFPDDVRVTFSHIYFDPAGFSGIKERIFGAEGAVDLAKATWMKLGERGEKTLEVPDAGKSSDVLSLQAFVDNARGRKTPLNSIESARISTLTAILGRTAIHERRIVEWKELVRA